ncbi:cation diffusion facilitator family transporter [Thermoflavimicrobium daqui]|jgi:cation diffusion facilitator family transporter|uniref:Cation-efflux pump n=1 Tax=Thermoflavimicrobium daqui TaxID=2137476 RepID=A0A364K108_9BACL|nr:cation diffusion facilitator family transporter [Thermoflavimicrobium daqui]RAL21367.1 cation-efflux pump [Thermoflavimicrobium daqui]
MRNKQREPMIAAWISLVSNVFLTGIKIIIGFLFQSPSLIADGAHNAADVFASGISIGSMRVSNMPADDEHPYGHGKAEIIASGLVAITLLLVALLMIYHSVVSLFEPAIEAHFIALIAALVSLIWKQLLYIYTIRIGKEYQSKGLIATAYDHLSDVYASLAAVIGIGVAILGNHFHIPYTKYGDPIASIVVSVLILKVAIHMGKESIDILMERNVSEEKLDQYKKLILAIDEVKRIDRIRAREHGHYILVDVRVGIPGYLTVQEGHDVSREIKRVLMVHDSGIQEVLVHINPWYEVEEKEH